MAGMDTEPPRGSPAVAASRRRTRLAARQIGTRSVGQCQILGATSGGFDGLAVCGRPQARRLRRPASRLRGLTSATHRQVGIDATVAEFGSLPRSDVSIVSDAVRRIQSRLSQLWAVRSRRSVIAADPQHTHSIPRSRSPLDGWDPIRSRPGSPPAPPLARDLTEPYE